MGGGGSNLGVGCCFLWVYGWVLGGGCVAFGVVGFFVVVLFFCLFFGCAVFVGFFWVCCDWVGGCVFLVGLFGVLS